MKHYILKALCVKLQTYSYIKYIKRVDNNIIKIEDGQTLEEYNNSNEKKMTYKLKLTEAPSNIQLCSFSILIEDSEDNHFEATTETIYIKP